MMLKMKSVGLLACCALAAGALFAAGYSESFESASTWTGGERKPATYTSGVAGTPLPNAEHSQVLVIEGDSTYDASSGGFAGSPLVDMMVKVTRPDEELEIPVDAHIAVAVDTTGKFNVYCKNKSGVANWYPLSSKTYEDDTWARVSLLFDYANGLCQVRIDGEPMMTANGYLKTDKSGNANGAWYTLAVDTTASTAVNSVKVVGCTAVDDVVIAANASNYAVAAGATGASGLSCAWLDQYGLGWDATTAATSYDATGKTVAQKYNACLSPFDGQTFAVKSVKATASQTVVGIPATVAVPGRQVVLEYGSTPSMGSETPVTPGQTEVSLDLPAAGAVTYFHLKAKAAQ